MTDEAARYRSAINTLVRRAKAVARAKKTTVAQVSKALFSDRRRIDTLAKGGSLAPETFAKAVAELERLEREQVTA